ncbi:hypothetical protein ACFO1B_01635 [Dactylosporangium siamense]|uniref:Uncharacterized protein n=1 Tax=Dactylosporangium siamense TaxID=685454 RepID=A0A919PTS6_9ACTN|nr:hypothetical protein [Dactylosporangium siamense]GIG48368.1 hypothetical protein Dsi01nite_064090 [Dactylosporangium siamense]
MTLNCWRCHRGSAADEPACAWCGVWLVALDPARVPAPVRSLLAPARRWGISDDVVRVDAVDDASPFELDGLVEAVDGVDVDQVDAWLCGPEGDAADPTNEYVAVSALMMAAELARLRLDPC